MKILKPIYWHVGRRIQVYRVRLGVSVAELGARIGISEDTVRTLERDPAAALPHLPALADALAEFRDEIASLENLELSPDLAQRIEDFQRRTGVTVVQIWVVWHDKSYDATMMLSAGDASSCCVGGSGGEGQSNAEGLSRSVDSALVAADYWFSNCPLEEDPE